MISGSLELLGDPSEVFALVERLLQLKLCWNSGPIPGNGAGSVRASTLHLPHLKHPGTKCVPNGNEDHAVVHQLSDRRQPARPTKFMLPNQNTILS